MPGFSNITGDESIMYADNVSFNGTERGGKVTTNGQLLIGATASPRLRVGNLTSTGATITITNGAGTINLESAASVPTTFQTDTGSATPAVNILTIAGGSGIDTTGAGSTVTVTFDVTEVTTIATNYTADAGSATPAANSLAIVGGTGIDTSGAGSTLTVTFDVTEVATIPTSVVTDAGTVTPAANSFSILGGPGVTVTGSGAVVTVNSVVFTDQAGSTTVISDSGSFATAAITLTTPAAPTQGELMQFVCTTANALIIDAAGTHLIRIGTLVTSAGGTATSTAIGDSLTLRYYAASTTWIATQSVGTWTMA